ncbi:hypothetical protein ACFQY4_18430 [Catellatospora bangladeshensis]|uniref:hypothetical protein n=1 Tax=Catellatospora bangladeshensis TaxID=310355 RepID=UPI00360B2A64
MRFLGVPGGPDEPERPFGREGWAAPDGEVVGMFRDGSCQPGDAERPFDSEAWRAADGHVIDMHRGVPAIVAGDNRCSDLSGGAESPLREADADGISGLAVKAAVKQAIDAFLFPGAGLVVQVLVTAVLTFKRLDNTDGVKIAVPVNVGEPLAFEVSTTLRDGASRYFTAPLEFEPKAGEPSALIGVPSVELQTPQADSAAVSAVDSGARWRQELAPGRDDMAAVVIAGRPPLIDSDLFWAPMAEVIANSEAFAARKTEGMKIVSLGVSDVLVVDRRNRRMRWIARDRNGTWSQRYYGYEVRLGTEQPSI